jgi:hypothetical protein
MHVAAATSPETPATEPKTFLQSTSNVVKKTGEGRQDKEIERRSVMHHTPTIRLAKRYGLLNTLLRKGGPYGTTPTIPIESIPGLPSAGGQSSCLIFMIFIM